MPTLSPQFVVPTANSNSQSSSHVGTLFDGRTVVAWVDFGVSGATLKMKVYNADGTVSLTDTIANPDGSVAPGADPGSSAMPGNIGVATSGDYISVTGLTNGGWVIAWQFRDTATGNEDVFFRVFNSAGVGGAITRAHAGYNIGDQIEPDVTWTNTGFAITWQDTTNNGTAGTNTIMKAEYSFTGAQTSIGRLDDGTTTTGPGAPDIAYKPGGLATVYTGNSPKGVYYKDASGVHTVSSGFFKYLDPGIAFSLNPATGTYQQLVVWMQQTVTSTSPREIWGAIGTGTPFKISTSSIDSDDPTPGVTAIPGGGWLIVWSDSGATDGVGGAGADVIGRVIGANGAPIGAEFAITDAAVNLNYIDQIAIDTLIDGRVFVSWNGGGPGFSGNELFGRYIDTRTAAINVTGNNLNNQFIGTAFNDVINGAGGNDNIRGEGGNDRLTGAAGADTLNGGLGNDTYVLDADTSDTIIDAGGLDTIVSTISRTLANGSVIENIVLTGAGAANATGNNVSNMLIGNTGSNTLTGNDGHDILDPGSAGTDVLNGGNGNDIYRLGSRTSGVTIIDASGVDRIETSVSYTLPNGSPVENLTLTGTANINGTGNTASNTITGNTGNNVLSGGAGGTDVLIGGAGNDSYNLGARAIGTGPGQVNIIDTAGTADAIWSTITRALANGSAIENITLIGAANANATGNSGANVLTGNAGNNGLNGLGGSDVLKGGAGADTLDGGTGSDAFHFDTALNATTNVDTMKGLFESGIDRIWLKTSVFSQLAGGVTVANFVVDKLPQDADDYLIYDTATGTLYYDADGSGSGKVPIAFLIFTQNETLTFDDFKMF